ncbi:odorant receptor 47a-like isoform X2 [Fopius arisanus]|nr:PREDICTED: odorant receptor 47a-like isoform X2 [Fopius arisanus]
MGLYSMGAIFKDDKPQWHYWETIPFIIGLGTITVAVIFDIRNVYDTAQTDFMMSIEVAAAVFTVALAVFKGYRLWFHRKELYNLLTVCHRRWNILSSRNHLREDSIGIARNTRLFRICYTVAVVGTVGSYNLRPYVLYLKFHLAQTNDSFDFSETVYPAHYPFTLNTPIQYFLLTTWENCGLYFLDLWWIAADCLFAQLTTHFAIQFNVLSGEIRRIEITPTSTPLGIKKIIRQLKRIIREHVELLSYVHAVEEWYNPIIFATILLNGLNLCTCLYSLQYRLARNNWRDAVKNTTHATTIALQTFLFCSYAQRLNDEINGFRQAIYECSWVNFNMATKTMILVLMIHTEREYVYSAYGFFNVNMPQVTVIFSTAMRFFTLLRSVS